VGPVRVRARARRLSGRRVEALAAKELAALRNELARLAPPAGPRRWNANPEDVQRSVGKLILALAEFLRRLLERQALRRMEAGTLTPAQLEAIGLALMRLEETIHELARRFGLSLDELNLDLGPLGRLT
jgi:Gas vesicle protein K